MKTGRIMEKKSKSNATQRFERAYHRGTDDRYVLRLYVAGATPASQRAIAKVKLLCDQHLKGRYELEIVDIYQQPKLAQTVQIVAVPTLVKLMPSPLRKFIGDMSKLERTLLGPGAGPSRTGLAATLEQEASDEGDRQP